GPQMVRDVFRLMKEKEPAIICIDGIDAIATARFDAQTGASQEDTRGCDIQKQEICEALELHLTHHELYQEIGINPPRPCGDPRMVRDVFRLMKEKEPAIISIDEVDAIATTGFDAQTGAGQETLYVKVVLATNRADTVDPALLCPGRLDRKIEFPLPDRRQKRLVFQVNLQGHVLFDVCSF
ncbi:UNVERIFIED_CONTAM: 26S proteasome regulatory subunitB, partial [Sesamum radiatum]